MEKATFAAGCFWGVEDYFLRNVEGVVDTVAGFTGGHVDLSKTREPYKLVCTDKTGHAEAVEITFDPDIVSYETLVETFFHIHDPTQKNRQGPDVGTQYRSAIFYHDETQREIATTVRDKLNAAKVFKKIIATEIVEATEFYRAEEYHQRYIEKNGDHGCLTYISF